MDPLQPHRIEQRQICIWRPAISSLRLDYRTGLLPSSSASDFERLSQTGPNTTHKSQPTHIVCFSDTNIKCDVINRFILRSFSSLFFNPLNPELNPICYLLALLAHHFLHVSRIRVKSLTLRLLMSYIYMEHLFLMFLDHT